MVNTVTLYQLTLYSLAVVGDDGVFIWEPQQSGRSFAEDCAKWDQWAPALERDDAEADYPELKAPVDTYRKVSLQKMEERGYRPTAKWVAGEVVIMKDEPPAVQANMYLGPDAPPYVPTDHPDM